MIARPARPSFAPSAPGRVVVIALYLYYAATVSRTLVWFLDGHQDLRQFPWVMSLELAFLVLYTLTLWRPFLPGLVLHLYFLVQSCLVLSVLILVPDLDFATGLFLMLSCQIALNTHGRIRQGWIFGLVVLTGGPVLSFDNPLRNLALQLSTMAGIIVLAAYIAAMQEEEAARAQSSAILAELQDTHQKLQVYASQAKDLAAIEERNRLARELHDSVSQTLFSIILNVRASQLLMERDPSRLRPQLETLQGLTQSALGEMRRVIAQLRPK
jgi:signal transduction histidine kinase